MTKRRTLPTRSFGAEPGVPDIHELAAWVAGHRGKSGDLISYQLDQSLAPQVSAGITVPCAGGKFYQDRLIACLAGIQDSKAVDEISVSDTAVIDDAVRIVAQKKGIWCALPAPHALGIADSYYHDPDEWSNAISGAYRSLMRSMRDAGIAGHVLICDQIDDAELSALSRQKVFFFQPIQDRESLEILMEYQRKIAVSPSSLDTVFDIASEYDLHQIIIQDADEESIARALSLLDPDQVVVGGYCTGECGKYWSSVVESAGYNV
jgi:hypothetical protein